MLASQIPAKFPLPFAAAAGSSFIRPIPTASQIGITNGAASLTDGFPPLTSIPIAAGGTPPSIKDVNGILQQATAWLQWQNAGGPVGYDAGFSTAIGGYPKGAVLSAATFGNYWLSTADNNTSDPDTGGANWVGFSFISAATSISAGEGIAVTGSSASFTGSISGTTLSVSAVGSGTIAIGMTLSDTTSNITSGTTITGLGTGTGGTGTYVVSTSQTVGSEAMTGTLKTVALAFENLLAGATINPNDYLAFYAEEAEGGNPAYHHYKITVANLASQIAIAAPGSRKNLQIVTVSTTAINLTADFVALGPNSSIYPAASVSVSINTATSGAGGVDTGGISASQTYDIYLGHNPTTATTAAWLTIEGNAPTVPSGYANYQRIGWTRTDGSSNLYRIFQNNDHWQYVVVTSSNTPSMVPLWSGSLGSWDTNAAGSYAAVSLVGLAPVKSVSVKLVISVSGYTDNGLSVAPNNDYTSYQFALVSNPPYATLPSYGNQTHVDLLLETASTIYGCSQSNVGCLLSGGTISI